MARTRTRAAGSGLAPLERGSSASVRRNAPGTAGVGGIETILVAVGGPYANRLLDLVGELARGLGATVVVFHMRERPFTGSEWILGEGGLVEGVDEATRVIDLVIARLRSAGVGARGLIRGGRVGQVGREILEVAAAEGADLIVLGCHRRSVLDELLGGSVARRVRRGSTVPVLVVPRHQRG